MTEVNPGYDLSLVSISRIFLLFFIPFLAFSLGLFPSVISFIFIISFLSFNNILHIAILPFLLLAEFLLLLASETIVLGLFAKLFQPKSDGGTYDLTIKDKTVFKYMVYCMVYRHPLKILNIFNLLPLRIFLLRLAGLKLGSHSRVLGNELIEDPFLTEIGENTLIGGYTIITAHLIEDKLHLKPIKIGSNCLIGGDAFVMPGVTIEDNVTLGAKSLVLKDKVLKKGRLYGGIPAKEIKKKK